MEQVIKRYESRTGKSKHEASLDMGIVIARYYAYRSGRGNPTTKTLNNIITVISGECPDILVEVIIEILCEVHTETVVTKVEELLSKGTKKRERYGEEEELALSGNIRDDR